jgi:hypothetical protein
MIAKHRPMIRKRSFQIFLAGGGLAAVLIGSFAGSAALAASPRDELLRLVPPDAGFCLVLEDIRGHGTALLESPFFKQFRASPAAGKIIASPETRKLSEIDEFLQKNLHISSTQLRDEIIGEALVLVYRAGPPGKPEDEEGMLLLHARDAKLLSNLLGRINELQKDSGDLEKLEERTHAGAKYFHRVEAKGENFYYLRGPLLAFSTRERMLRQLIERDTADKLETESVVAREFRSLGVARPLVALWVNPRAFDRALDERASAAAGAQAVALKNLRTYWKALEGIAVSVDLEKDFELALAVRANPDKLPHSARRFIQAAAHQSELWACFPDNSMIATAVRFDIAAFVDACSEFLAEEARVPVRVAIEHTVGAILGPDLVPSLVPHLGPDMGLCVVAPAPAEKSWVPQMIVALRVRPGEAGDAPELTLANALNSLATLLVFTQNAGRPGALKLQAARQDSVDVKYLVDDEKFPPGFQPAFALKDGYALVAGSPDTVRRFHGPKAPGTSQSSGEIPLVRISLREICTYVEQRRGDLINYNAASKQISKDAAASGLDTLIAGLKLFDRVELTQRPGPDRVNFTLRVRMSQPLK